MAKLLMVILTLVVSLGIFYTPKVYADDPGSRKEIVYMDGQWYEITYDKDGGIVTIRIHTND